MIDHHRDYHYTHFQIKHIIAKYSLVDHQIKKRYETPQFTFMRMAMALSEKITPADRRLTFVKDIYELLSDNVINAPSPNYIYLGTRMNGLVSCCLYTTDDDIPSLSVGNAIAYRMTAIGAGIGAFIRSRGQGEQVRGGAILHNGMLPYYKSLAGDVKANMQAGRAGAATSYYNIFNREASVIAQLQNPRTPANRRNRDIHFAVQYHSLFLHKALMDEQIFTFSCKTAPDLFAAFYSGDKQHFIDLYKKYEQDDSFVKEWVSARELLVTVSRQRPDVGTHYEFHADNANYQTPFLEPIYSSNLCLEIMEVTHPYKELVELFAKGYLYTITFEDDTGKVHTYPQADDFYFADDVTKSIPGGELQEDMLVIPMQSTTPIRIAKIIKREQQPETALCSLGGIVEPNVKDDAHYEKAMYYCQHMIDYCIEQSDYPFPQIAFTAKKRRNAGIGLVGAATTMARRGVRYDTAEGLNVIQEMAERHLYFAIKNSIKLGKERGNAEWMFKTKWPTGWLPMDNAAPAVETVCPTKYRYDWEEIRRELIANKGMRFSCLVAHMPTESSSKAAGVPNSWYPVRELSMGKSDANNVIDWVAMDSDTLKDAYQIAWTTRPRSMTHVYAVIQRYTDQGISADKYKDRSNDFDLSAEELIMMPAEDSLFGLKSGYYLNSKTDGGETASATGCGSGGCTL